MPRLNVITGATGQLGSHIAEQLVERGEKVRVPVRPGAGTAFLESLRAEVVPVDYQDVPSLRGAMAGADVVYHCAARVSDWGPWRLFQAEAVDVARNVLDACAAEQVGRVLFVSSISVYGHPRLRPGERISEESPLGQHMWLWDHYARAKILAENLARQYRGDIVIARPSWIYGPRDRVTTPRIVPALRSGRVPILGRGDNLLNLIYAGDVAAGCILAATHPGARGQVYNLSGRGELTQQQMVDALTDALGLPRIQRHMPFFLVRRVAFIQEMIARLLRRSKPPTITRRAVYLIGRPAQFSTEKAQHDLGWEPRMDIHEGVKRTLAWYFAPEEKS
jgi:nucleoside-diphosphate-sugar epimerase